MADHEPASNTAAYVLGTLEPDERRAFEAHLATCAACAEEVRTLRPLPDALAQAAPLRTPSAGLRRRVLAGAASVAPRSRGSDEPRRALSWMPLAASIVLTVAVGVYAGRLQTRVALLEARLAQALDQAATADALVAEARTTAAGAQAAMAVLAAPDVARIDLAGQAAAPEARARALWSRDRGMVFTVANLPQPPEGRVYQVWVVTAGAPISVGLLTPDANGAGSVYFDTPADIPAPVALAVTLEPAGGVPAPTGAQYLVGTPSPL
jgi:anti-sigma-K factor RskA